MLGKILYEDEIISNPTQLHIQHLTVHKTHETSHIISVVKGICIYLHI